MNLVGIVLVAVAVAGGVIVVAVASWVIMLLVRSSVEVACRVTMLLVRSSVRRDERPLEAVDPEANTIPDLTPDAASRGRVHSDSLPLRVPVTAGARHGDDVVDH
jgi:hypothetical protein